MAQRVRDYKIHLKGERAKLPPRREPYWRHIDTGRHVGYRRTDTGSETWIARWTDDESKYHYHRLGTVAALDWTAAKRRAEEWFKQCDVGILRAGTVEEVCKNYVDNRRVEIGDNNANDAEKRFKAHVYGKPIGRVSLDKLSPKHIEKWRNDLLEKSTAEHTKRTFKTFRAALNYGFRQGEIASDTAWRRVSATVGQESANELDFYWTVEQRRKYIAECPKDLSNFLTAISYSAARPQEIASALVEDFDPFSRKLVLRHRKGHRSRLRVRDFHLSNDAALEFFKRMAKDKTPKTPLLTRADGSSWYSDNGYGAWVAMVKRIRRTHKFDDRLTAYHFRHWSITDWLNAGIVATNVATLAGTSTDMIDTYYKKFVKATVDQQLKALETV